MSLHILILPLASGLLAQIIKFLIKSNNQKWDLRNLIAYSGMPSGHSAMVIALVTIVGLQEGISSPFFAISAVFALVVIRDALGLRRYLGQHGKMLNIMVKDLKDDKLLDEDYPRLLERIGHTPAQVIIGALIGFAVSILGYILI